MANLLALGGEIIGGGGNCSASNVDFDNTGTTLSSTNVQDAIEEIFSFCGGTIVDCTVITTTIPGASDTRVASMVLQPGHVYSIFCNFSFNASFSDMVTSSVVDGVQSLTIVRNTGNYGGGFSMSRIIDTRSMNAEYTVYLNVWQGSSSTQSIINFSFQAVSIM